MIAVLLCAGTLWAETIPVVNHSFEQPQLGTEGQKALPDVPGWRISGKSGVFANDGTYGKEMAGATGGQLAYLNGTRAGELAQDVLSSLKPSTAYVLSAAIGLREDSPLSKGSSLFLDRKSTRLNSSH